jgi:hypothetical protein
MTRALLLAAVLVAILYLWSKRKDSSGQSGGFVLPQLPIGDMAPTNPQPAGNTVHGGIDASGMQAMGYITSSGLLALGVPMPPSVSSKAIEYIGEGVEGAYEGAEYVGGKIKGGGEAVVHYANPANWF